jgi:hypothetical protein
VQERAQEYSDGRSTDCRDAIGFPEFLELLQGEERWPEGVRWSQSPVFPEERLSPPDVPQRLLDASRQVESWPGVAPDAPASPAVGQQKMAAGAAEFSSPLPADSSPLQGVPIRDRRSKPSPREPLDV